MQEMQEMQVQSLGGEDPLEECMATLSSILTRKIPWTEETGGLWSMGSQTQTWQAIKHAACIYKVNISFISIGKLFVLVTHIGCLADYVLR